MELEKLRHLAHQKLSEHGLINWTFKFDKSVRRFGSCKWHKTQITISSHLASINTEARCLNTLLHEIAHALAGAIHNHDKQWESIAKKIGCDGDRCYTSSNTMVIQPVYQAICSHCRANVGQYFRRRKLFHKVCHVKPGQGALIYIKLIEKNKKGE
jgi:predicted SprT family Zn-dependent metalloprotease